MKYTEDKESEDWFDFILDRLNSDTAFDILFNIFDGCPYAEDPLLAQAVASLKIELPSAPDNELARYIKTWVEHHESFLKDRDR
jgi:hypothetical protein